MMRGRCWWVVASLLVFAVVPVETEARIRREVEGSVPSVLFTTLDRFDPAYPTFVGAEVAFDPEGNPNPKLFHPISARTLTNLLDEESFVDGCYRLTEVYDESTGAAAPSRLAAAVETSSVVVTGRVVGRRYGFQGLTAGQLLEIAVEERLKGHAPLDTYLVFFPAATFEAGPYRICKTDLRFATPPDVGEELLILVPEAPDNPQEPFLDTFGAESLITLEGDGSISLPRRFRGEPATELPGARALVEQVRHLVLSQGEK